MEGTLKTIERLLKFAGPLVETVAGEKNAALADKILGGLETAIGYARMGLNGAEDFSEELEDIVAELEAMDSIGGPGEGDFDAMAERVAAKTDKLRAVVEARKAAQS
jgi:hypothetical protein